MVPHSSAVGKVLIVSSFHKLPGGSDNPGPTGLSERRRRKTSCLKAG